MMDIEEGELLYQCMWCRKCCLFGREGLNRLGRTGCPELFRGRVIGSPSCQELLDCMGIVWRISREAKKRYARPI